MAEKPKTVLNATILHYLRCVFSKFHRNFVAFELLLAFYFRFTVALNVAAAEQRYPINILQYCSNNEARFLRIVKDLSSSRFAQFSFHMSSIIFTLIG